MMKQIALATTIGTLPFAAFAQSSPWLPYAGSGQVSVAVIDQAGDDFWVGKTKMTLPTKIKQDTVSVGAVYALNDDLAIDGALNYTRSRFAPPAGFPIPHAQGSSLSDSTFGVRWRALDEFEHAGLPTVTLRAAAIIKGNYDTGIIDAVGDGGSGVEGSVLVGKYLTTALSVAGELGYRHRNNGVPADLFSSVELNYGFSAGIAGSLGYSAVRSRGWLDIGAPGFSPSRFPEVREDRDLVRAGLSFSVAPHTSLGLNYGKVVSGRNTTKAQLWGASLSQAF